MGAGTPQRPCAWGMEEGRGQARSTRRRPRQLGRLSFAAHGATERVRGSAYPLPVPISPAGGR
eukprot:4244741-Alexandrium_andersonii.AAC.1